MTRHTAPAVANEEFHSAVYAEMKRIARHHLRTRGRRPTLETSDLVHETYLKLSPADGAGSAWENRAHFFAAAAKAMREVMVDHARRRSAVKRGGGAIVTTISTADGALAVSMEQLLVLNDALERLRELNERLHRVVELRFFGGLSEEEIAELLHVSPRTVERDWAKARLFLLRSLHD